MNLRSERDEALGQMGVSPSERREITANYEQRIVLIRAKVKEFEMQLNSL